MDRFWPFDREFRDLLLFDRFFLSGRPAVADVEKPKPAGGGDEENPPEQNPVGGAEENPACGAGGSPAAGVALKPGGGVSENFEAEEKPRALAGTRPPASVPTAGGAPGTAGVLAAAPA